MGLEFLHLAERSDHAEVEDRALARRKGVVTPGFAPAVLGDEALKIAVEVVGARERAIDVFVAEHLAAHGEAAIISVLIHFHPPACARCRRGPRAGFQPRASETAPGISPRRRPHWRAPPRCVTWPRDRAAPRGQARTSPPAANAPLQARQP